MGHFVDGSAEHDVLKAQLACEGTVIAVERSREQALVNNVCCLARRDEAVIRTDAQRVVAVGRLKPARHGNVLPWSTDAYHLDARPLPLAMPLGDLPLQNGQGLGVGARGL